MGTSTSNAFFIDGVYIFGKGHQVYVTNNDYQQKGWFHFFHGDIYVETPINKVANGLTGVSVFQTGYENSVENFYSELDIIYVGIPLMIRVSQFNVISYDFGFLLNFTTAAILDETRNRGTSFEATHQANISRYLSPVHLGSYFGISVNANRYRLGFALQGGQSKVDEKILDEWPIGNGSMFLRDIYPKFRYQMFILKLGIRLR